MKEKYVTLGTNDILRLGIRDFNGNETGEYLEFDFDDIELPLRYQELLEADKKNRSYTQKQLLIIDKRQDVKGHKMMSKNEEDKIKVLNEFFKKEVEIYNMFLGENGVQKLLNGRKLGWTTLKEIDEIIEKQILPYVKIDMKRVADKIKKTYSSSDTENNTLEIKNKDE